MENTQEVKRDIKSNKIGARSKLAGISTAAALLWTQITGAGCAIKPSAEKDLDETNAIPTTSEQISNPEETKESIETTATINTPEQNVISYPYPKSSEGFILDDTRTTEETDALIFEIKNNPNYGYAERVNLYYAKMDELGINKNEYTPSIWTNSEGPGWSLTMVKDNEMYLPTNLDGVPNQDLILNPSASLENFSLVVFSRHAGLKIVWDKSNWPILMSADNSEWLQLGYSPIGWQTYKEKVDIVNSVEKNSVTKNFIFNDTLPVKSGPERNVAEYSQVNLADIINEEILKQELDYVNKNSIFNDQVIPATKLFIDSNRIYSMNKNFSVIVENIDFPNNFNDYRNNPDTRPIKIISYYKFYDPEIFEENGIDKVAKSLGVSKKALLDELENRPAFWIISWAYYNPDESITIGHSFVSIDDLTNKLDRIDKDNRQNFKFLPGIKHSEINYYNDIVDDFYKSYIFLEILFNNYPNLYPYNKDVNIKQWIDSGQMPQELQNALFTLQTHSLTY
ncbi:MAG: hypothetical protein ABIJ05_00530 [Patescibacteria group bacterium]